MKHDPSVPMQRLWQVQMVPGVVTIEQLTGVLSQSFMEVEMVHQRRRGSTRDYTFKAKTAEMPDSIALTLDYGQEQILLWVRRAPPKGASCRCRRSGRQVRGLFLDLAQLWLASPGCPRPSRRLAILAE